MGGEGVEISRSGRGTEDTKTALLPIDFPEYTGFSIGFFV